uniref:Neurexin-1 n=1 Tax=Parascaris univalens TaxID=6257 RepID=A0A915C1T6_PARUN
MAFVTVRMKALNATARCRIMMGADVNKKFPVKIDAELSFFGQEWLGYDVGNNSAAVIRSRFENISFAFKTVHGRQVLFVGGDRMNYIHVTIDDGSLVATSKFDGTEKRLIRISNEYPSGRYDDDQWHKVAVTRTLTLMTLSVDGRRDEIRQYAPEIDWLVNSYAFVGGIPKERGIRDLDKPNFRGCMKQVIYQADAHLINFIGLADQGYGQSVIRSAGDLTFSCRKPTVPPDILSFNSGQHYITLPKWNSLASGSIGFQLRTYELDGLILYHGSKSAVNESSDYIAFELIDGHLFLIINLGSGHVRLQTTASKVTEGTVWHSVMLERMGRSGTVIVDNVRTDFSTPGVSANLIVDEPIYIGAVPWPANDSTPTSFRFPSTVWTANLRQGYVGCLKNVRFNGISANIASVYEEQKTLVEAGISQGCPNALNNDYCTSSPCKNFGRCEIGYRTFRCDCSNSYMEGPTCSIEPEVVELSGRGDELPSFHLPNPLYSEAETVECKFRTEDDRGIIFDTKSTTSPSHRILITLLKGELELHLDFDSAQHTFNWGSGLNDDHFHSIRVKRRGEKLLLFLDGKWEHSYFLPSSNIIMQIDQVAGGHSLHPTHLNEFGIPLNATIDDNFSGEMIKLTFNGYDVLKNAKRKTGSFAANSRSSEMRDGQKSRNRKAKYSSISFDTSKGRVVFSEARIASIDGPYRISFKFRTLSPSCILLVVTSNSTYRGDFVSVELFAGRIRYSFGFGSRFESVISPILPAKQTLNDMRWHSLLIYQNAVNGEHHMLIDNTTSVMGNVGGHVARLEGQLFLGGLPPGMPLSPRLADVIGFRGCISSLRIGDEHLDAFVDAEETISVTKGCAGPLSRCSPSSCSNGGRCIQKWNSVKCDCSMTTYGGSRCDSPGTTYVFDSSSSMIFYEYPPSQRPSTNRDRIAIGFQTRQASAVLLSVQCTVDGDYLTVFMNDGFVQVRYNLGTRDHVAGLFDIQVNDDIYHVLTVFREEANLTLFLDNHTPLHYAPKGSSELFTLNMQWRVSVGGSFNLYHKPDRTRKKREKIFDAFHGKMAGVNFNGLMILDLLAQGSPFVQRIGSPRLVHMSSSDYVSGGVGSLIQPNLYKDEMVGDGWKATSEGLIYAEGSGCIPYEEHEDCQLSDPDPAGLITPILTAAESSVARTSLAPRRVSVTPKTPLNGELHERTRTSISFAITAATSPRPILKHFSVLPQHIPHLSNSPKATHVASTARMPTTNRATLRATSRSREGDRGWAHRLEVDEFVDEKEDDEGSGEAFVWPTRSTPIPFQITSVTPAMRLWYVNTTTIRLPTHIADQYSTTSGQMRTTLTQREFDDPHRRHGDKFDTRMTYAATRSAPLPHLHPFAAPTQSSLTLSLPAASRDSNSDSMLPLGSSPPYIAPKLVASHLNKTALPSQKASQSWDKFFIEESDDNIQRVAATHKALLTLPPLRTTTPFSYLSLFGASTAATQRAITPTKLTLSTATYAHPLSPPSFFEAITQRSSTMATRFVPTQAPSQITSLSTDNTVNAKQVSSTDSLLYDNVRVAVAYDANYFQDLWSDIAAPRIILSEDIRSSTIKSVSSEAATLTTDAITITKTTKSLSHENVVDEHKVEVDSKKILTATPIEAVNGKAAIVLTTGTTTEKSSLMAKHPHSYVPEQRHKAEQPRITSVALLTTRHRARTTLASHTVYAVRPTTPMGDIMTSTSKGPAAPTDFPRTALISIASLSVIIIIAIVVFCVFRCRQSGPSTDQYPMVCNGKQSGYAPIPTEMSPQMVHHDPHHVAQPVGGPFIQARVNHLNGYQPIKGAVIPNTNGVKNGNAVSNGRKKEFKEWYV